MGNKSKIEWTDATWNPIRGCSRVSEGCRNCYAEAIAARFSKPGKPYYSLAEMTESGPRWTGDPLLFREHLLDPIRWKKPKNIFVNSMSDLFHEKVERHWIDKIFMVMAHAKHHTFQILTKRPERLLDYITTCKIGDLQKANIQLELGNIAAPQWPFPNVWLGVSIEDQKTADERIPLLLQTPAAVHWISAEPLLGEIHIDEYLDGAWANEDAYPNGPHLDWVVAGGESGPNARPMHPDWPRSLRDQCQSADVPFFFKQWGEWRPRLDGEKTVLGVQWFKGMSKVGKKSAGRLLDGRTWDEFPRP